MSRKVLSGVKNTGIVLIAQRGNDKIGLTQNMAFDEAVSMKGFRTHSELFRALPPCSNYTGTSLKYACCIPSKDFLSNSEIDMCSHCCQNDERHILWFHLFHHTSIHLLPRQNPSILMISVTLPYWSILQLPQKRNYKTKMTPLS